MKVSELINLLECFPDYEAVYLEANGCLGRPQEKAVSDVYWDHVSKSALIGSGEPLEF